jgi:UrcA family protein
LEFFSTNRSTRALERLSSIHPYSYYLPVRTKEAKYSNRRFCGHGARASFKNTGKSQRRNPMPRNSKSLKTVAIAAIASVAVIGAAQAQEHSDFSYKESELQSAASVRGLYKRIANRAESACGVNDTRALYAKKVAAQCEAGLVEDWIAGIDDPRLNRMHAQYGKSQIASVN